MGVGHHPVCRAAGEGHACRSGVVNSCGGGVIFFGSFVFTAKSLSALLPVWDAGF